RSSAPSMSQGIELLAQATSRLLGPPPQGRRTRIMVTVAGDEPNAGTLIRILLQSGMNCLRINCAHNKPEEWLPLVRALPAGGEGAGSKLQSAQGRVRPQASHRAARAGAADAQVEACQESIRPNRSAGDRRPGSERRRRLRRRLRRRALEAAGGVSRVPPSTRG